MSNPTIRIATVNDLDAIIALLADDKLGAKRETTQQPLDQRYLDAFLAIDQDSNHLLVVAEIDAVIAGCLQLSFIPGLSRTGMWRGQIESVRVASTARGTGLGKQLVGWAIDAARKRGCGLVQLTTDKSRPEALKFYQQLGFVAGHEGLKLSLGD